MKLGLGIGWRPELAWFIERRHGLGFVEVLAEDFNPLGPLPTPVQRLRQRGLALVPHGVSLSLGGAEPLDPARLQALANLARLCGAPLVSEHLAFVRAGELESGHLLPLPYSQAALELAIEHATAAQQRLPVPLALENIATLFHWPDTELDEPTFLSEVLRRADVQLLLDVENIYANARNLGGDPITFLDRIPLDRIAYVHVAGGVERKGVYHDTHAHPTPPPVLNLLEELCSRVDVPGVLLERDDHFPSEKELNEELDAIAEAVNRGARRRERTHACV